MTRFIDYQRAAASEPMRPSRRTSADALHDSLGAACDLDGTPCALVSNQEGAAVGHVLRARRCHEFGVVLSAEAPHDRLVSRDLDHLLTSRVGNEEGVAAGRYSALVGPEIGGSSAES